MNPLADELNRALDGTVAGRLLSDFGRRMYFPRGIIAQSVEAKKMARKANATIGMAYAQGKPLVLPSLTRHLPTLEAQEMVAYAPTAGDEKVRELWKRLLLEKNPSLDEDCISLPVVVPGITAGISYTADLFLPEGGVFLASQPSWDNYRLIFEDRRGGILKGIPFFNDNGRLDIGAIASALREQAKTKTVRLILNFPNNPAGYSPVNSEVDALVDCIHAVAEEGADVLVISDDAYFGLFYEDDICKESIFVRLASLHERVLTVKTDGPTKEDYSWGFRIAMMTFGSKGMGAEHFEALVTKLMGTIRSSVSCSNTPAQSLLLKMYEDKTVAAQKDAFFKLLKERYQTVRDCLRGYENHPRLSPMPFNSGYFMSLRCKGIDAEKLRRELLRRHGIGTVSLGGDYLRVAFAGLENAIIPEVFQMIYETADTL
jgi:aspartate/methionine/tyrosine aminotransferase